MLFLRRSLLCIAMTAAIGSTGCAQVLGVALAAAFSALPRGGSHSPEVNRPVDRMMTVCELERGRWREENQEEEEEEDAMPPHLRCTPDGAYPFLPPSTAPARTATQTPVPAATEAPAPTATPARPEAPAPGPAETPAPAGAI